MTWTVMYCVCMPITPAKHRERTIILTTMYVCACNSCKHRAQIQLSMTRIQIPLNCFFQGVTT